MKQQTVISVVKMGSKGMVVTFNGGAEECLEGVGMVVASAVANMAMGGTPVEDIEKQIRICADYGMRRGLEQAEGVRW